MVKSELETEWLIFTLFGLVTKNNPTPMDTTHLNQVPVFSLKLRLTDLLANSNPARPIAITEKGDQQVSLNSGNTTPGYDARIVAIPPDRITVNYQGRKETILLFSDTRTPSPSPATAATPPLVRQLREQPRSTSTYLSISSVPSGDKLRGYRPSPGKDTSLFHQSGLQGDDLTVALNDIDLRDQAQV